jgi:hypothetical protein
MRTVPKISRIKPVINGKKLNIKVNRSSKLCKWLKIPYLVLWNWVYVRDSVVTRRIFQDILLEVDHQRSQGFFKTLVEFCYF